MADDRPEIPLPAELRLYDEGTRGGTGRTAGPADSVDRADFADRADSVDRAESAATAGKPRLRTVSLVLAGVVALILAVLAALVGASLLGIVRIAEEARNQTVPRVVQQHRDALSAAELGRLAEVILGSAERSRRAAALEEAEALSARFARVAEPAAVERLERALSALRLSSHRADLIDSLTVSIREGLSEIDDVLARATVLLAEPDRGVQDYAFLASLYHLRRLYGQAMQSDSAELLATQDLEIMTAIRAQRALLAAMPPGASDHLDAMILLLHRFSDARTLSDLHRGRLAVRGQMRQDIDTAHRLLRDLSEGLTGGAAATTLGMADRIVVQGWWGLWTGVAGVTVTLMLLAGVTVLLRRHVIAPVVTLSGTLHTLLHALPAAPRAVEPPPARLEEIDRIGRAVARFARALAALHDQAETLRTGEARLSTILQAAPFPIMIVRRSDGLLLFANPQTDALLALPADRPPSFGLGDILDDPADATVLPATLYRLNRPASIEMLFRAADGRRFWGVLTAVAMQYEGVGAMFLAVQDMTARKDAEDALRAAKEEAERALADLRRTQRSLVQAEKLASLGSLVAGVAHEINTPVGIGVTAASFLAEQACDFRTAVGGNTLRRSELEQFAGRVEEASTIILANLERASTLVQSFKQVAVDQTSEVRRPFDLRHYLEDVLGSLAPQVKRTPHRVVLDCPDGLAMDSFPGALSQVVSNLVINALTHAFDGERPGTVAVSVRPQDGGWVVLEVADDGRGIPFENRDRVFEPFFTTRRGDGGSGLGLHIVHNIAVGPLGGAIALNTPPGGGSRFSVRLPCVAPKAA